MTKEEALDKYPNLESLAPLDLVVLRKQAIDTKDDEFKAAIDAMMKPNGD